MSLISGKEEVLKAGIIKVRPWPNGDASQRKFGNANSCARRLAIGCQTDSQVDASSTQVAKKPFQFHRGKMTAHPRVSNSCVNKCQKRLWNAGQNCGQIQQKNASQYSRTHDKTGEEWSVGAALLSV